jgi:hypothetical protein
MEIPLDGGVGAQHLKAYSDNKSSETEEDELVKDRVRLWTLVLAV